MLLDIVIPSLDRIDKLERCLNSIFLSKGIIDTINIYLYFSLDKDYNYFYNTFKDIPNVFIKRVDNYRVPTFWNDHLKQTKADALCYANDDILFEEDSLETALKEFKLKFPDGDGVMGLRQANIPQDQAVEGAFGFIGIKYADHFPDRQVFCLDYLRFYADFELWQSAKQSNKFYYCTTARIRHLHPAFGGGVEDDTHKNVRQHLPKDKITFQQRKARNLLWGKTWELINA